MKNKLVSVIITTKNEEKVINDLLKSIKLQSWCKTEIIVVDNNSSDKTVELAKKFTKKIYSYGPERAAQRNYGAKKADGEFLLFLDADMKLTKNVIKECVTLFTTHGKIGGAIIPEKSVGSTFWAKVKAYERSFYEKGSNVEAARFFPSEVFQKVGGFDEEITGPEDWDLSERVARKYKIARIKSKIIHNEQNLSLVKLLKKKYYYAKKAKVYLKKNNLNSISPKTIPFLRSEFYKNPSAIILHPVLFCAMICMLIFETVAAGIGYIKAR